MTRLLLIDADDGPGGGGGAALGRIAKAHGFAFDFVAFEALASGFAELEESGRPLLLDESGLVERLHERDDEMVIPCSRRALDVLHRLRAWGMELPATLEALLEAPRFPDLAAPGNGEAGRFDHLAAGHLVLREAPDRDQALKKLQPGVILSPSERLQIVTDAEEAWFRLRALERAGDWPAAFFPLSGRGLYCAAAYVAGGRSRAQAVLKMDGPRECWRPALGRSVSGQAWERALDGLAVALEHEGFVESLWLHGPHAWRPELIALRPLPAPWIDLAAPRIAAALEGRVGGLLEAGFFHADIPVDRASSPKELHRRSTCS